MYLNGRGLTTFLALCLALGCLCQEEPKDNEAQTGGLCIGSKIALSSTMPCIGLIVIYLLYRALRYGPKEILSCWSRERNRRHTREEYYENGGLRMREATEETSGRSAFSHGGHKGKATQHPAVTSSSGILPALPEA